jgi:hypothetical protein
MSTQNQKNSSKEIHDPSTCHKLINTPIQIKGNGKAVTAFAAFAAHLGIPSGL